MANSITKYMYHYQPKVNAKSNEIVGYECLIRAVEDNIILTPDKFLHKLQEGNSWPSLWPRLFSRLGFEMQKGNMTYAINVSPSELVSKTFRTALRGCMGVGLINPNQIELEITEYKDIKNYKEINQVVESFNNLGVKVWLDDFGAGYSSFNHLKRLHVQGIKIDRCIISGLESSSWQQKVVESLVQYGYERNSLVLAEGIETHSQLKTIKNLGCDLAQGFYLGKPQPAKFYTRPHTESCSLKNSPAGTEMAFPASQVGL